MPYFHGIVSFSITTNSYRISTFGRGIGPYLHRMGSLGMTSYSHRAFLLGAGPGTDGHTARTAGHSPVSIRRSVRTGSIGTCTHGRGTFSGRHSTDPGGQGIVAGGAVVQVVVASGSIRIRCGLDAVVMGHGFFQLGQVHGVAVFTTGGHIGNLTAGTAIANGKGPFPGLPVHVALYGGRACFGIPAGDAAGTVCLGSLAQGDGAFFRRFGIFAHGHGIFHGSSRIADGHGRIVGDGTVAHGYGRIVGGGIVAHGYGIAAVGGDIGAGGDGVAGSLIEGDGVEIGRVVRFLIVVDGLTIFLVGLRSIAGDFCLSDIFSGGGVCFRIGMDILGRGGRVAASIPEDLGNLRGIAAGVFIPDSIFGGGGLLAVGVHVVGYLFVGNFGVIADGRGIVPFCPALVPHGRGAAGFCGFREIMGLAFSFYQLAVGISIHWLTIFLRFPLRHIAQGIGLGADGGVVFAIPIVPFCHGLRIADDEVAFVIVDSGCLIAQINSSYRRHAHHHGQHRNSQGECISPLDMRTRRSFPCRFCQFRNDYIAAFGFAENDFENFIHMPLSPLKLVPAMQ